VSELSANKAAAGRDATPHLRLIVNESYQGRWISDFFPLMQKGFIVKAGVGCSVMKFLREEAGATEETIEKIQSIFLDGKPVDDLDHTTIKDGSTMALSGALPGLVGATLRRGGAYSGFRSTITYTETAGRCISGEGFVRVKLFNILMGGIGPAFLKRGVFVKSSDLRDFLTGQSGDFVQRFSQVLFNGQPIGLDSLQEKELLLCGEQVFLSVADAV
jgi:hypothetical protein